MYLIGYKYNKFINKWVKPEEDYRKIIPEEWS